MYDRRTLGLAEARAVIDAVLAEAEADADAGGGGGAPVAVAVVDPDGDTIVFARMDGTTHLSRRMAVRKAYTSARMGADSGALGERMGGAGIDLGHLDPEFTGFGGGVCLTEDGVVVGAVAVSGRSPGEDEALARSGAAAIGF